MLYVYCLVAAVGAAAAREDLAHRAVNRARCSLQRLIDTTDTRAEDIRSGGDGSRHRLACTGAEGAHRAVYAGDDSTAALAATTPHHVVTAALAAHHILAARAAITAAHGILAARAAITAAHGILAGHGILAACAAVLAGHGVLAAGLAVLAGNGVLAACAAGFTSVGHFLCYAMKILPQCFCKSGKLPPAIAAAGLPPLAGLASLATTTCSTKRDLVRICRTLCAFSFQFVLFC
jgi:hypothetical protein